MKVNPVHSGPDILEDGFIRHKQVTIVNSLCLPGDSKKILMVTAMKTLFKAIFNVTTSILMTRYVWVVYLTRKCYFTLITLLDFTVGMSVTEG